VKLHQLFENTDIADYIKVPEKGQVNQFHVMVTDFVNHYKATRSDPGGATDTSKRGLGHVYTDGSMEIKAQERGGGVYPIETFAPGELIDMVNRRSIRGDIEVDISNGEVVLSYYESGMNVRQISFDYNDVFHEV
jgi:hypothetical protein